MYPCNWLSSQGDLQQIMIAEYTKGLSCFLWIISPVQIWRKCLILLECLAVFRIHQNLYPTFSPLEELHSSSTFPCLLWLFAFYSSASPLSDNNRTNRFNRRRSPFLNPDETRSALQKSVQVTCFRRGMMATVSKEVIQVSTTPWTTEVFSPKRLEW